MVGIYRKGIKYLHSCAKDREKNCSLPRSRKNRWMHIEFDFSLNICVSMFHARLIRQFLGVNSALQKELLRGLKRWETSTRQHSAKAEDIVGSGKIGAFPNTSSSSGSSSGGGSTSNSTPTGMNNGRNNSVTGNSIDSSTGAFVSVARNVQTMQSASAWAFQLLPELYNHYQKVADIFRRASVMRAILSISSLSCFYRVSRARAHARVVAFSAFPSKICSSLQPFRLLLITMKHRDIASPI